jgi:hypothetical protein
MGKGTKRSTEVSPKEPSPATAAAQAMIDESRELNAKPPKTSIHRLDAETGDRKFVARVTTDVATEEWLARKFGPGTYVLTHQIPGATGAYEYHSRDTFIIDESSSLLEPPEGATEPTPAAGASSPAVASGANILERAMEAGVLRLLEQSARHNDLAIAMVQRITEATDRPRGPSLLEIITAATPIITAIIESRKDPTETAVALANLLSKRSDGGEQSAAMFERGISLAMKLGDRSAAGGEGGMMPVVVGEGIRVLGGIVDAIVTERRVARGEPVVTLGPDGQPLETHPAAVASSPAPLHLVPNDTPPVAHIPAAGAAPDRPWISVARGQLPLLLSAARFMPAAAAADTIAANLSPTAFDDLLKDIEDQTAPGFAGRLVSVFPQIEGISPEWFGELVQTLLEIAAESAEEPPPVTPATPDKRKPAAGARK